MCVREKRPRRRRRRDPSPNGVANDRIDTLSKNEEGKREERERGDQERIMAKEDVTRGLLRFNKGIRKGKRSDSERGGESSSSRVLETFHASLMCGHTYTCTRSLLFAPPQAT